MERRVVVTGISAISSVGINAEENWAALVQGRSGIGPITRFNAERAKTQFAGEVKNFDPEKFIPAKDVKMMCNFIQFAVAGAKEAIFQSGLATEMAPLPEAQAERVAAVVGCGLGGLPSIEETHKVVLEKGPGRISPFFIPKLISNLAAGQIGIYWGLQGPNYAITSACSSGAHAIGESYRMIKLGIVDVAVTGGAEATITELCVGGFNALRALSTRNAEPTRASRPFDKDRDGFVVGEGAGILVIEEYEHARKRNANILGEIVGYAANCDGYHMTAPAPEGRGAAKAMKLALADAKISGEKIGVINAHGTSTPIGDVAETQAIKTAFGAHAKKIKVTSTKSMVGHTLGAAGGIESVYTLQGLMHQVALPTINLENPDPQCDLDYVPNEAQDWKHDYALSNSFGFGGTNACLIFKRI